MKVQQVNNARKRIGTNLVEISASNIYFAMNKREAHNTEDGGGQDDGGHARNVHDRQESHASYCAGARRPWEFYNLATCLSLEFGTVKRGYIKVYFVSF